VAIESSIVSKYVYPLSILLSVDVTSSVNSHLALGDENALLSPEICSWLYHQSPPPRPKSSSTSLTVSNTNSPLYAAMVSTLTDLYLLSHCSTLVGSQDSNLLQLATLLSNATGTLRKLVYL